MTLNNENETILIFEPHPDDVVYQLGGSVYTWVREGRDVRVCTVTTGNNSTLDPDVSRESIAATLAVEHAAALDILGVPPQNCIQWQYDDLGIDPHADRPRLLNDMMSLIRDIKPATVVTMDPLNMPLEENPDHRAVAAVGFEAAAHAACPHVLPQAGPQHFVGRVLFYMSPQPDTFVNIEGEAIDARIRAGLCYASQLDMLLFEARRRAATLGLALDILNTPAEILWPEICKAMAAGAAQIAQQQNHNMQLAESFRTQYPGVLEKLRGGLFGNL